MSEASTSKTTLVIFAGTTGFGKSAIIQQFTEESLKLKGYTAGINSPESRKLIRYFKFDDELIKEANAADVPTYLENPSNQQKTKAIEATFRRIRKELNSGPKPKYVFLDIHLSYIKRSEFIPPINFANYDELVESIDSPIKVITLIDDSFHIWDTIRKREEKRSFANTRLRLREISAWRSVELLQAETIAKRYSNEYRNVVNYEVSVRHPSYVLRNLIFQQDPVCSYLSFGITNTRNRALCVEEINNFRRRMHSFAEKKRLVMFDPVTIDELVVAACMKAQTKRGSTKPPKTVSIESRKRWPLGHKSLGSPVEFPLEVPGDEIKEVVPDIVNNIRARDYKLIDTSIATLAYRPFFNGRSVGSNEEIR